MSFRLSPHAFETVFSAFGGTVGAVALLIVGMGLGVCSLSDLSFASDILTNFFGWPFLLVLAIFQGSGILVAFLLMAVLWGLVYDVWSKARLFAWTMVLGAATRLIVHFADYEAYFGWPALLLLLPAAILALTPDPEAETEGG